MLTFRQFMENLFRSDTHEHKDFTSYPKTHAYYHSGDWTSSGSVSDQSPDFQKALMSGAFHGVKIDKGMYAGSESEAAMYSGGGRSTPFAHVVHKDTGESTIAYHKRDQAKVEKHSAVVSEFPDKGFKKLPTGEYFTHKPQNPIKQTPYVQGVEHTKKFHKVEFVDDLGDYSREAVKAGHDVFTQGVQ